LSYMERDPALRQVIDLLISGHFNPCEPGIFDMIIGAMMSPNDPWMVLGGFPDVCRCAGTGGPGLAGRSALDAHEHPQHGIERLFLDRPHHAGVQRGYLEADVGPAAAQWAGRDCTAGMVGVC